MHNASNQTKSPPVWRAVFIANQERAEKLLRLIFGWFQIRDRIARVQTDAIHQPQKYWRSYKDRTVSTRNDTNHKRECESMNRVAAEAVQDENHDERCQRSQNRTA